jgi:uncharacterized repeat protein (TIGR03806 family)
VNVALWSDGADKERYLALPEGEKIVRAGNCGSLSEEDCETVGDLELPKGSVLMKIFRRNGVLLETRLLMRHSDGDWAGYTYVWNAEQTAATLGGAELEIEGQDWLVPSHKQCLDCHTRAAGRSLGLEFAQLNGDFTYPSTGRTANQLATWSMIGLFDRPLTEPTSSLPKLKSGEGGDATELARGYLHANCSHCHRAGTPVDSPMDLRYTRSFADMNVCNAEPTKGEWPEGARVLVPGSLELSLISLRPHSLDPEVRMPQIGSRVVHEEGVALIDGWVQSISECP